MKKQIVGLLFFQLLWKFNTILKADGDTSISFLDGALIFLLLNPKFSHTTLTSRTYL